MSAPDLFGTAAFRWSVVTAVAFAILALLLFAFVYWQTAGYERRQLDAAVVHEARLIAAGPAQDVPSRLRAWLADDLHNVRYGLLLDRDGRKADGNLAAMPAELTPDGVPRLVETEALDADEDARHEVVRAVALRLDDGRQLVLGLDTDEIEHARAVILRALGLGLAPMLAMALAAGLLLGRRALRRVSAMDEAIARIVGGDVAERLPVRGHGDEFDRLARSVNIMLDDMARLLEEVRGVGDSIAHDLRTPLTRARLRLERSHDAVRNEPEVRDAIGDALFWLDQTFATIAAILRIGEVEHGRRRAGFRRVALAPLLRDVVDLYEPIAQTADVKLALDIDDATVATTGDRDLLFEAVGNLVDNAVKFSKPGGLCTIALVERDEEAVLRVSDQGPGIPKAERELVLKRFYRSDRSRRSEGSGLGLALVAAVARLHGFDLSIGGEAPGCYVEIRFPSPSCDQAS